MARDEDDRSDLVEVPYDDEFGPSAMARCFFIEGAEHWVPKSLIEDEDRDGKTIMIPRWKAEDMGVL